MNVVKEYAYAKINLYLDVISKRNDGFHEIKTVMHTVSLFDKITVSETPSSESNIRLSLQGNKFLPTDGKNLAVKACEKYLNHAKIRANVDIKLEKHIPVAAGLAGGSADAAAVLRAMNRLNGRMFSQKTMFRLAEELGSDVPFCLYGKTALCEGRGEILTKLPDKMKSHFVIAVAGEHMSTPVAYDALDKIYSDFDGTKKTQGEGKYPRLINALSEGMLDCEGIFNVFEDAVLPMCPGARSLKDKLLSLGANGAMMSGSGPSVFGIFKTKSEAERANFALRNLGITSFYACSV